MVRPSAAQMRRRRLAAAAAASILASATSVHAATPNTFEIVGDSGVSAQQIFLAGNAVYVVDKTENNPMQVNGHPAWGSRYDLGTNQAQALNVLSNSFCAGGSVLGNGTWLNVGGNQPVTYGGLTGQSLAGPYVNADGGMAVRLLDPKDDGTAAWVDDPKNYMTTRRWYPTLETLEDGSIMIIGGCNWGGFVNDASQNNPTYEFFPSRGRPVGLNILTSTLPANLFPLTWLLPSGNIFIQTNWGTEIFDYKNNAEHPLANIPDAVKTYPASGATAMLPLTPENNYTATILLCGGNNLQPDQWVVTWNIAAYPSSKTCVKMTPDVSTNWENDDDLPEGRVMGNLILLPDGRGFVVNGIGLGVAGYGNTSWAVGQAFGTDPIYMPAYYDPKRPAGSRFYRAGIQASTVPRLYHSVATLLPDGSVWVSGSNPNADYIARGTAGYPWPTEYRVEKFYPDYYNEPRPQPKTLPKTLSYGGQYFDVDLPSVSESDLNNSTVVVIRTGFSTHAMNMGQRMLVLQNTYTVNKDNSGTLHVSQMPPNPAMFPPGPALLFVVVNGVPSQGVEVMVGNGQIGTQPTGAASSLPGTSKAAGSGGSSGSSSGNNGSTSGASVTKVGVLSLVGAGVVGFAVSLMA